MFRVIGGVFKIVKERLSPKPSPTLALHGSNCLDIIFLLTGFSLLICYYFFYYYYLLFVCGRRITGCYMLYFCKTVCGLQVKSKV